MGVRISKRCRVAREISRMENHREWGEVYRRRLTPCADSAFHLPAECWGGHLPSFQIIRGAVIQQPCKKADINTSAEIILASNSFLSILAQGISSSYSSLISGNQFPTM